MKQILRNLGIALATLALAGCSKHKAINAPAASSGSADFSVIASIGTSVSSGYESGGLVVHHQTKAFPYAFATQVGSVYTIPSVSADGIPALLQIAGWTPQGQPIINNTGRTMGSPTNALWPKPYSNMAVPGAILNDVIDDSRYGGGAFPLIARPAFKFGSILDQVAKLNPTFVTFEMGANEVLGPASQGSGTPVMNVPTFAGLLHAVLDSAEVLMPGVKAALFTVPDITSLPYFTTISPRLDPAGNCRVLGPRPNGGPPAPLADNDLVLLPAGPVLAGGHGVPGPCGGFADGLAPSLVLYAPAVDSIQTAVDGYNAAIRAEAATRGWALVDLNGLLKQAAGAGFVFQGQRYTSSFVTGGLISLDGVHPTDLAHGLIGNALIAAVNEKFGARIPLLNLAAYATGTSSRLRPVEIAITRPEIEHADQVYGALFRWRGVYSP